MRLFPESVRGDVDTVVNAAYWPTVGVLLLLGLVTFYHLAPPNRLPWRRGFPGAVLAGVVFLGGSLGLRLYIGFVVEPGLHVRGAGRADRRPALLLPARAGGAARRRAQRDHRADLAEPAGAAGRGPAA